LEALYTIACQRKGRSTSLSRQAIGQLVPAAQQGNWKAQMALVQLYMNGKQPDDGNQAYHWAAKAAESGHGDSLFWQAVLVKNGSGHPPDPNRAANLLQLSADSQGHIEAQALLGAMLLVGDGITRNLPRGISYLKAAANAGSSYAAWKMALCLKNGLGALRDTKEAEKWFDKAAEGKFDQGPPWKTTVPQLQFSEAIQTFQTLASVEHRQAHYWLGICYENGVGVPRDLNKALELYMRSANKGFQPATDAAKKLKEAAAN